MNKLNIFKVNSLPVDLEPSSLYLIKQTDNNKLIIYLTDNVGNIAYKSYDSTDIVSILNLILSTLIDQPEGIAGLNLDGDITLVNESLKCYTIEQIATSDGIQYINIPGEIKINTTNYNLYINGLKQPKTYTYEGSTNIITIPATFNVKTSDILLFEYYLGKGSTGIPPVSP